MKKILLGFALVLGVSCLTAFASLENKEDREAVECCCGDCVCEECVCETNCAECQGCLRNKGCEVCAECFHEGCCLDYHARDRHYYRRYRYRHDLSRDSVYYSERGFYRRGGCW